MPAELRDFLFDQLEIPAQTPTVHVFHLDRMLNIGDVKVADRRRPARPQVRALQRPLPRAHPRLRRRLLRRHPRQGHRRPPSLRELRRRRAVPAPGGARSGRGGDQADALPHLGGFADRQGADRGGRGRQDGDGAGRAQGALRRGGQHPLGARPGARRRAGRLRLHRPQDPRQGLDGGAARGAGDAHLRAFRHRQLPSDHGAHLHRPVVLHLRSGDGPRRRAAVQLHDGLRPARADGEDRLRAGDLAADALQPDRRRDRQRQGRPAGRDLGQAQLAGRRRTDRPALRRLAGRRADRPGGPRHLLPAARHAGPERAHPRQEHDRPLPRARAHRLLRQRQAAAVARRQGVHLLGRLDAAQPRPPGRAPVPGREPDGARAGARPDHGRQPQGRRPELDHGAGRILQPPASGQGTFHRAPLFHDQPVPVRPRQRAEAERRGAPAGAAAPEARLLRPVAAASGRARSPLQSRAVSARGSAHGRRNDRRRPSFGPPLRTGHRQGPRRHHRRRLQLDPSRRLRAGKPGAAAGVQREGAVRPGPRPRRHRPPQSRRRRDGAGQHRPLHDARAQHEGDVARPAGDGRRARRRRRRGLHARARAAARHQGPYRERPGRGALLGLSA